MASGMRVDNGDLFIAYTWGEFFLMCDGLMDFLIPQFEGRDIPTRQIVLHIIIVITCGEASVRRYMVASETEVRVYILSFGCCECCERYVPSADVFWCITFTWRCTGYKHLVGISALIP